MTMAYNMLTAFNTADRVDMSSSSSSRAYNASGIGAHLKNVVFTFLYDGRKPMFAQYCNTFRFSCFLAEGGKK
jgi:hypothetical protein